MSPRSVEGLLEGVLEGVSEGVFKGVSVGVLEVCQKGSVCGKKGCVLIT